MIKKKKFDFVLAGLLILLILCGCFAIFTASTSKIGDHTTVQNFWWKQLIFAACVIGLLLLLIKVPMPVFEVVILPLFIINIIALIGVLFTPAINGSHRWYNLGGFNWQPSESAKLLTILLVSRIISKEYLSEFRQILYGFCIVLVPVLLILIEPDFGTTMVFWFSLVAMLIAAELPTFYIVLLISPVISIISSISWIVIVIWAVILIGVLVLYRLSWITVTVATIINLFIALMMPVFWNSLKDYQQNRIITFFNPSHDPLGAGYQIIQAKIAIGSGGTMGKGLFEGTQKNMNFLPEHHTDFIFSVIGEEFGYIGCMILLIIFFLFFWRLIAATSELKVKERKIVTAGIFAYLMFQTFINIGMNIGLVPATGVPLPFISYGGSNLLINSIAVGIVLKYLNERGFIK